ncbi:winged helix DNA-binding domain-containing protein [Streptomyces sp. ventii]|uniref:Winged helix DNA-binding domain-containing protein n=2 Tax=Streptomyces spiramenti TaxID=2720606 RepID=A0ABX1AMV7_9ACTN|nr:winged helix DNA-binding domain-containing protein [Streptomyces spiramenti]
MPWAAVSARRLARHRLDAPAVVGGEPVTRRIADVVSGTCGVHAQVMSAAEVSVAMRVAGAVSTDVRDALWRDRTLVRTHGPRGTVHLLSARDLPAWVGAMGGLDIARGPGAGEPYLDADQVEALVDAAPRALAHADLTADELTQALADAVGAWAAEPVVDAFRTRLPRWRWVQPVLGHRGALCFGPKRGREITFTSPVRLLPGFVPMDSEPALRRLALRYLHGYGPATPAEFARWLGAPRDRSEELFRSLGDSVEQVTVVGSGPAVQIAGDPTHHEEPRGVRLLPYFDVFGVGCHPRSLLFAGAAAERALSRGQAGNYPLLLVNGQVAGVWHQALRGRRLRVTVEPLVELAAAELREVGAQARRLADIRAVEEVALVVGRVPVGPHA